MTRLRDNWPLAMGLTVLIGVVGFVATHTAATIAKTSEQVNILAIGLGIVVQRAFANEDDIEKIQERFDRHLADRSSGSG